MPPSKIQFWVSRIILGISLLASARAFAALELMDVKNLRPTQFAVGQAEVTRKTQELRAMTPNEKIVLFKTKAVPLVRGPGGEYYMIDRHHLARAAYEMGEKQIYVEVISDWSTLEPAEFWARMEKQGYTFLGDETGRLRSTSELPHSIELLKDDPYRSLAGQTREAGGFSKSNVPFAEFAWANFFREHISQELLLDHPAEARQQAMALARQANTRHLPGWINPSCAAILSSTK